jgi:acyl carrier protein
MTKIAPFRERIREQIQQSVINIVVNKLDADKATITRDTNIGNDLGADSADFIEILGDCEEEFGIEIPLEEWDAQSIATIGNAIDYIEVAIAHTDKHKKILREAIETLEHNRQEPAEDQTKIERESSYDIFENEQGELLFTIKVRPGGPENQTLLYAGGEHAILYRSLNQVILLDFINPDARSALRKAEEILIAEMHEGKIAREYTAPVRQVSELPVSVWTEALGNISSSTPAAG